MYKFGVFTIKFEYIKNRKIKKYLFLDSFDYSTSLEYLEKTKHYLKIYANLSNVNFFEYDKQENVYITYNTSKKIIKLKAIKNQLQ